MGHINCKKAIKSPGFPPLLLERWCLQKAAAEGKAEEDEYLGS